MSDMSLHCATGYDATLSDHHGLTSQDTAVQQQFATPLAPGVGVAAGQSLSQLARGSLLNHTVGGLFLLWVFERRMSEHPLFYPIPLELLTKIAGPSESIIL